MEEYYRIAPAIVEQIERSADRDSIYDGIYQTVQSCLSCIRQKEYGKATAQYRDMVYRLRADLL